MKNKNTVVVDVLGGVAHIVKASRGVRVIVRDFDADDLGHPHICRCSIAGLPDAPHWHNEKMERVKS